MKDDWLINVFNINEALELGKYNIRVNSVNPTVTFTPMGEKNWSDPAKSEVMLKQIPVISCSLSYNVTSYFLLFIKKSLVNLQSQGTFPML
jgi:hypothetical protein